MLPQAAESAAASMATAGVTAEGTGPHGYRRAPPAPPPVTFSIPDAGQSSIQLIRSFFGKGAKLSKDLSSGIY